MNRQDPKIRQLLAGECVLGTLHGLARQRFEHWLSEDPALRRAVEEWERNLNSLALVVPEARPPARVWRAIKQALKPVQERRWWLWNSLGFWRTATLVTSVLVLILAGYIRVVPMPSTAPTYMVMLSRAPAQVAWLLGVDLKRGVIMVRAQRPQPLATGKAFELWVLPRGGQTPRSLGLIPASGRLTIRLPPANIRLLREARGLIVTLEPTGGSPSGRPTGPVLYQGLVLSL